MARTGHAARETFLVEHYRPGLSAQELGAWAARLRVITEEMRRDGKPVRYLRSTIVPVDESLLCMFEAPSEELVREAYARAEIPFERISAVIHDGTSEGPRTTTKEER